MNLDLFGSRPKADPQKIASIKEWTAEVFQLPADVSVMVTELRCTEPGCPPLETVIAILTQPGKTRQYKIEKALAEVTFLDVLELANRVQDAGQEDNHQQE
jgi:hypothetical protein